MSRDNWNDHFEDGSLADSTPVDVEPRRSRLRLDEPQAFIDKLAVNVAIIFAGLPLVVPLFMLASALDAFPILQAITSILAESVTAFFFLAMIYVWCKPPWFRSLYLFCRKQIHRRANLFWCGVHRVAIGTSHSPFDLGDLKPEQSFGLSEFHEIMTLAPAYL